MALFEAGHIGVQFRRDGQPFAPFADVGFSLEAGCLYNLTGPSGSGKSTLLNACALMLPRSGGTLALEGVPVDRFKPTEWRRRVCLVPQAASLVPGTVRDNLLFPWTLKVNAGSPKPDDDVLNEMLSLAMLDGVTLDHAAAQLSGGQLARVALLRAFATRPTVLLLDEVEAALDGESAVAVSRLTRAMLAGGAACLRIRHRAEDGYAYGVFTLADVKMTYHQNEITADNAPAASAGKGCDSRADEVLAKLKAVPSAPSDVSPLVGSAFDPTVSPRSDSPSLRPAPADRKPVEPSAKGGVVNIGYVELVGASLLMLVAGIVSWRMGLGQSRRIAVSTVRAFLQLLAMGLLLGYLFKYQTWWLVCLVLLGMCIAATQIATGRTNKVVRGLWADVFLSITVSSMVIAFIVVEGIIHADPWYNAMQLVPISGMILGNTLAAAAVATERLFASMDSRANEIYMMVALGATPREAAFPSIKAAVGAGMTPLLAQLSAAGIVQIPGMMSGQILAGADPVIAAKYQIVVLLMISAATTLSVVIICFLAYKKRFSTEGYYLSPALRDDAGGAA